MSVGDMLRSLKAWFFRAGMVTDWRTTDRGLRGVKAIKARLDAEDAEEMADHHGRLASSHTEAVERLK